MPISTPSSIKLAQHGANKALNLKINDKIIATIISDNIIQDILRKYLYSLSFKGFSGVSSGQRMNIKVANTKDILSNAILISYIFDSLISTIQHKIDKIDISNDFIDLSLEALTVDTLLNFMK